MAEQRTNGARAALTVIAALAFALPIALAAGPAAAWTAPSAPTWAPPPGALPAGPAAIYVERGPVGSRPGDAIAPAPERTDIQANPWGSGVYVRAQGDQDLSLGVQVGPDEPLVGFHTYVRSEDPFRPSLVFSFDGRGCTGGEGWVDVTRADRVDGKLVNLELTFESRCPSNPTTVIDHGAVRWDATTPPPTPNPVAIPADLWQPPAHALPATGNHLYLEAGPRTYVGAGTHLATGRDVFAWQQRSPDERPVTNLSFTAENATGLRVGGQITAGRYGPGLEVGHHAHVLGGSGNPTTGGLDLSAGSNGCTTADSWFTIDELTVVGGHITHIALRFGHRCSTAEGATTFGSLRWTEAPHARELNPNGGPRRGGHTTQIYGSDLVDTTSVEIGTTVLPAAYATSCACVEVTVPELPIGSYDVVVRSPRGDTALTGDRGYHATENRPLEPTDVTAQSSGSSAIVTWVPADDRGDGPLTGNRVRIFSTNHPSYTLTSVTVGAEETAALVTGLPDRSPLAAEVTHLGRAGDGLTSTRSATFRVTEPDLTPFDGVPALVDQQYVDFAGRAPTAQERSAAVRAIRNGSIVPNAYVASMRLRPEWGGRRAPITRLYSATFGRLPDAGGLTYWAGRLGTGTSLARASATFAASSEFRRTYGTLSDGAFVDLVYRNVLGRAADPSGRAHWVAKLARGASRGTVMASFSESTEHVRVLRPTVDAVLLHTGLLRRMPTAAELPTPASSQRIVSSTDPVVVADQILRSPAYAGRF